MMIVGADCDDSDRNVRPNQTEACNGRDDNCNGMADEGATRTVYPDDDGDGFGARGAAARMVMGCALPMGFSESNTDCDDMNRMINPAATELCDGVDNNCDGITDNGGVGGTFYRDIDGDGRGDPSVTMSRAVCVAPAGYVPRAEDCNDRDATVYVGAPELCDGIDNDCSLSGAAAGGVDRGEDTDGDHHSSVSASCMGGFPRDDCNDDNAGVYPAAAEICDSIDENCSLPGAMAGGGDRSEDRDGDHHSSPLAACTGGPFRNDDCNDDNPMVYTGAPEICDGFDDDCSLPGALAGGRDASEDHDHDGAPSMDCGGNDCDDSDPSRYPGNTETCDPSNRGHDEDCDPCTIASASGDGDRDHDGFNDVRCTNRYISDFTHPPPTCNPAYTRVQQGGYASIPQAVTGLDCDDGNRDVRPNQSESCNGIDDNCNGIDDLPAASASCGPRMICAAGTCVESVALTGISAGLAHTCALSRGHVLCWGQNDNGQVTGIPTSDARLTQIVSGVSGIVQVAAGGDHTCALRYDGTVVCWGRNSFGALGDGSTLLRFSPVSVTGLDHIVSIGSGYSHSCALRDSGSLFCWGDNYNLQLGNGSTSNSPIPVVVSGVNDAMEISTGHSHNCARRSGGAIVCWGSNGFGELGNGTTTNSGVPVSVTGVTDALEISTGGDNSCARRAAGTVTCWGHNAFGQNGDGTNTTRLLPVQVQGISDAIHLSHGASSQSNCIVRAGGSMACWGRGDYGQLGEGFMVNRSRFVVPVGLIGLSEAVTGAQHTCARTIAGSVYCWGTNGGRLGDGTLERRLTPTAVLFR